MFERCSAVSSWVIATARTQTVSKQETRRGGICTRVQTRFRVKLEDFCLVNLHKDTPTPSFRYIGVHTRRGNSDMYCFPVVLKGPPTPFHDDGTKQKHADSSDRTRSGWLAGSVQSCHDTNDFRP